MAVTEAGRGQAPVVLCLTAGSVDLGRRIAAALGAAVHGRSGRTEGCTAEFTDTAEHCRALFAAGHPLIGLCAAGILIRALAPLIGDKHAEPPVLAVAEDGSAVIPLLGGHRGANILAREIAALLGIAPAITTGGELTLGVALDAPPPGWRLGNPGDAPAAMAALVSGAGLRQTGPRLFGLPDRDGSRPVELCAADAPVAGNPQRLVYHPQRHVLGVGCARGADPAELWRLTRQVLAEADIAPEGVAAIGTLDLKADEPAVIELGQRLGVPVRLFAAAELERLTPLLANPSDVVFAEVGCHGVAEAAALALAGAEGWLSVTKRKSPMATTALASAPSPVLPPFPGRSRGRVSLVGIGPGQAAWRTPEASRLIAEADELVGYGLYIDLLGPLANGRKRRDFALGQEEARCRYALEEAGKGRDMALICSGDAGIYAMGALLYELLDRSEAAGGVGAAARRVELVTAPGISAMQAAAARAGAPLGHDFCAISLSDLLTPRQDILRRVRAAAEGDFVVAFYNPVSRRRRTLLGEARDLLLTSRSGDTPVALANSLGRPEESLRYCRLADLDAAEIDMLTVVLVGSSQSRLMHRGEGARLYTPRGYARRIDGDLAVPVPAPSGDAPGG